MTTLQRIALVTVPMTVELVEKMHEYSRKAMRVEANYLAGICASHERLRGELDGSQQLHALDRNEVADVLIMLDELAELWGDEGKFRACRDRLRKIVGGTPK